ncbi:MAG: hypothetical protein QM627_04640 [Luteolibacter sp.]
MDQSSIAQTPTWLAKLLQFVSPSGSFSRIELLIATSILIFLAVVISIIAAFSQAPAVSLFIYCLYPIWGIALGKRSRDLGTTFTYGMIIGMIFPIIGLIFLFQPGAKANFRTSQAEHADAGNRASHSA